MTNTNNLHYLQIEPTTRCNFTCGFCAGRKMQQVDMDLSAFKGLVDRLDNVVHVELQGEGEPLLHPDWFAMVQYLREKFPKVKISLITNGSLFTPENIEKLLSVSLSSIMVSLESTDEDEFQAIRGGKLSRVKRGIAQFVERKKALNVNAPRIGFTLTLLHSTYHNLNTITDLYNSLGMDGGILAQPLQSMAAYTQFYDADMQRNMLNKEDYSTINNIIAKDNDLIGLLTEYQQSSSFYSELYHSKTSIEVSCPWLENGLFVSATNIATSCCFIKNVERDGFAPIAHELNTITDKRSDLLRQLTTGETPKQCKDCGIANKIIKHYGKNN